ncbi:hypothetical protein KSP40_PGU017328 [Platanthera guangdongensis]|uniref:VOC domain-containing protein n=1 Tax=Platanthera guangdongensis TaxID=2320717 RepID=A0ABR2MTL4_9ASPA
MTVSRGGALSLKSLNHISRLCGSLEQSVHFYQNILGFRPIVRPSSFNFNGAWLFNYGFGIHLLQVEEHEIPLRKFNIDLNVNHISFQCANLDLVEKKLAETEIGYIRRRAEKWGLCVDQLFFHDPDGFMIEVCSFENLPMISSPAGERPGAGRLMEAGQLPPQVAAAEAANAATATEEQCPDHIMLHCC